MLSLMFQAHPWHGVSPGDYSAEVVQVFIEIVPTDTVKSEVHKPSGHIHIDRPQRFSSMCPTLYGFIPQTYCGKRVATICEERTRRKNIEGDGDPNRSLGRHRRHPSQHERLRREVRRFMAGLGGAIVTVAVRIPFSHPPEFQQKQKSLGGATNISSIGTPSANTHNLSACLRTTYLL
jgi:hypothetical protein